MLNVTFVIVCSSEKRREELAVAMIKRGAGGEHGIFIKICSTSFSGSAVKENGKK